MSELKYPILTYNDQCIVGLNTSEKKFKLLTKDEFEQRFPAGTVLIDSLCRKFVIDAARNQPPFKNIIEFFKRRCFPEIIMLKNLVWVDLELSEPEQLTLDKIREEIRSVLLSHPDWYERHGFTQQEIESDLDAPKTIEELINSISIYP